MHCFQEDRHLNWQMLWTILQCCRSSSIMQHSKQKENFCSLLYTDFNDTKNQKQKVIVSCTNQIYDLNEEETQLLQFESQVLLLMLSTLDTEDRGSWKLFCTALRLCTLVLKNVLCCKVSQHFEYNYSVIFTLEKYILTFMVIWLPEYILFSSKWDLLLSE